MSVGVDSRIQKDSIRGEYPSSGLTGVVQESHQAALFLEVVVPTWTSWVNLSRPEKAALPVVALIVVGAAVVVGLAVAATAPIVVAIAAYAGTAAVVVAASVAAAVADAAGGGPIHCTWTDLV